MKILKILSLLILVVFISCKKDSLGNEASYYEHAGQKYSITTAQQRNYQGSINLLFSTANVADYLQLNFAKAGAILPEGMLTYHFNTASPDYNPQKNFNAIIFGAAGADNEGKGGHVTITKTKKGYQILFDLQTDNGKLTGVYNGTPDLL